MNAIWSLLLQNPDFWDTIDKRTFCDLRLVSKEFRSMVPEREAMIRIFKNKTIKIVNLFRILPLSVNDMLKIKSPVNFIEAFKIAEHKCGGFENCLAIMRERGLNLWHMENTRRIEVKRELDAALYSKGILSPPDDPVYVAAIDRGVTQVAVWGCEYVNIPQSECKIAGYFHNSEYEVLLSKLHSSMGHWYKGIHNDVRTIMAALRTARSKGATERVHFQISNNTLMVGMASFIPWADYIEACS